MAVAFQVAVNVLFDGTIEGCSAIPPGGFAAISFGFVVGASLLSGFLLRKLCPEAAGSGVPQVKVAFWKETGWIPWRTVWVKFLAGATSIGCGVSLGREGPSVQLAGGLASNIAGLLGQPKQRRRTACASGAAAGLAAAFNTPLAAIMFVIEEILDGLNNRYLGGVILASVLGALVVHAIVGEQPAFGIALAHAPSSGAYLAILFVAPISGLFGALFQRLALGLRKRALASHFGREWWFPGVGGAASWLLAFGAFALTGHTGVFGLGYHDLTEALAGNLVLGTAILLLVAKLLATATAYGTGGCGGIFAPSLFFGGMCGCAMASVADKLIPLTGDDHTVLVAAGMCACLSAVVRAPITAILMLFEMTQQFFIVPILMLAALLSEPIGRLIARNNFYETVLLGSLDPDHLRHVIATTPYHQFPLHRNDRLEGIVSRAAVEAALASGTTPRIQRLAAISPEATLREAELALIESPSQLLASPARMPRTTSSASSPSMTYSAGRSTSPDAGERPRPKSLGRDLGIPQFFELFPRHEDHRDRIHAVAQAARRGTIRKDVPEVAIAPGANHLGPHHPMARVPALLDGPLYDRFREAGPSRPRIELRPRPE